MFTLGEMECMGACVNAPMVAIADYTNVSCRVKHEQLIREPGGPRNIPEHCFYIYDPGS